MSSPNYLPFQLIKRGQTFSLQSGFTLTDSWPGSTRGRSLSIPGLVGDITEMDGRSIFCDSSIELEPAVSLNS